ncbi:protein of unknown function [Methylococcus capsulatus]|uniref:Uncharacterized protein n=1 Tax=Methylococcus capsulatus TaxID=414 RepID=A0AA35V6C3_METCP|nr:protein of unknown function [Methylococcus capsulatus]
MTSLLARNAGGGRGKSGFASFGAKTRPQLVGSGAALALAAGEPLTVPRFGPFLRYAA